MTLPRSHYVKDGEEGIFPCFNRCVRRAFLCGYDHVTGQDFSHRKQWFVNRLCFLESLFSIEVCGYAVMSNHFHLIVRTRPDKAARWSDREVAIRWLTLCPKRRGNNPQGKTSREEDIQAVVNCPSLVAIYRQRLANLSWFMAELDEFISRAANKEDEVTGRFWESRFKCIKLLDESALCSCMVYVDLNPIRAALAALPEDSDYTSIQERIRAWKEEVLRSFSPQGSTDQSLPRERSSGRGPQAQRRESWLCPISSDADKRGLLAMTTAEYIDLVDRSGRLVIAGKRGSIDADLAPILQRMGVNADTWVDTVTRFGSIFHVAAGAAANLRTFADQVGRKWIAGVSAARSAFISTPVRAT
jgi:hypothetical protein